MIRRYRGLLWCAQHYRSGSHDSRHLFLNKRRINAKWVYHKISHYRWNSQCWAYSLPCSCLDVDKILDVHSLPDYHRFLHLATLANTLPLKVVSPINHSKVLIYYDFTRLGSCYLGSYLSLNYAHAWLGWAQDSRHRHQFVTSPSEPGCWVLCAVLYYHFSRSHVTRKGRFQLLGMVLFDGPEMPLWGRGLFSDHAAIQVTHMRELEFQMIGKPVQLTAWFWTLEGCADRQRMS